MAIMLVTMLLILSVMRQAKPSPRFIFIQTGTINQTIEGTALIIRDEISFASPSGGLLKPLAAEGSRVARGQNWPLSFRLIGKASWLICKNVKMTSFVCKPN